MGSKPKEHIDSYFQRGASGSNAVAPEKQSTHDSKRKRDSDSEITQHEEGKNESKLDAILKHLENITNENKRIREDIKEISDELRRERGAREELKSKINFLEERVGKLEEQMERRENAERRGNVIIKGVEEGGRESSDELLKTVQGIITQRLKLDSNIELNSVERLGKKSAGYPRPILIKLGDIEDKQRIMKRRTELKGTKIFLDNDYGPTTMAKRKKLLNLAGQLNVPKNEIRLRGKTIVVKKKIYELGMVNGEETLLEAKN